MAMSDTTNDAMAVADDHPPKYHPGLEYGFSDPRAFEAYIAEHYAEPMPIMTTVPQPIIVISEQEEIAPEEKKHWRHVFFCLVCFLVAAILSLVVTLCFTLFVTNKIQNVFYTESPSPIPSSIPSIVPSAAPSSQGFVDVMNAVSNITSTETFMDQSSPQYKAAKFMSEEDPSGIRPVTDPRFLQRYALATFFFSTNGDIWKRCNPGNLCPGSLSRWLSDSDECTWMGLFCNEDKFAIQIKIGTYNQSIHASLFHY
jgi:hypothetical protein